MSGTSAGPWTQSGRLATPGAAKATGNQPPERIGSKGAERLTHIRAPLEVGQTRPYVTQNLDRGPLPGRHPTTPLLPQLRLRQPKTPKSW